MTPDRLAFARSERLFMIFPLRLTLANVCSSGRIAVASGNQSQPLVLLATGLGLMGAVIVMVNRRRSLFRL